MKVVLGQMWRLTLIAGGGPGWFMGLGLLASVVALSLANIQITVRLISWSADFYNALQKLDMPAAAYQVGVFGLLIGTSAGLYLAARYLRQLLNIRWRGQLTNAAIEHWTSDKAYWLLHPSLSRGEAASRQAIDNPDQRIAEDCNLFIDFMIGGDRDRGVLDFLVSLVGLITYVTVLWGVATFSLAFTFLGTDIEIPRYMVWAAPIYVAIATGLTHLLGRQLPGLLAEQQKREADFRFSLMRLRESAAAVALAGGESVEKRVLADRFAGIVSNWHRVIRRELILGLFQRPYFQTVLRIPMFLALPGFLAGHVTLGGLMQVASAFQNVVTTISWFIFNYKFISDLVATTKRLQVFFDATEAARTGEPAIVRSVSADGTVRLRNFHLHAPDGRELLHVPHLVLTPGRHVWLSGASGLGKSTLIKALAGLWPYGGGEIEVPERSMFMPQQVYSPLGSFADAAAYPAEGASLSPAALEEMLGHVALRNRSASDGDAGGLSVGEQQRLAMIRILTAQPDWVFLDEGTSALDLESESTTLATLARLLPRTTFVVVTHREPRGLGALQRIELPLTGLRVAVG